MRPVWMVTLGLLGVVLASCSSAPPPSPPSGPEVIGDPPSGQSSVGGPQEEVRAVYDGFWRDSWQLQDQPAGQWPTTLHQVATGPLADQLVERTRTDQQAGARLWGRVAPHVRDVQLDGEHAVVRDCQDTSRAGRLDASGAKTAGVPRNPVTARLDHTSAGWRVSAVSYAGGGC